MPILDLSRILSFFVFELDWPAVGLMVLSPPPFSTQLAGWLNSKFWSNYLVDGLVYFGVLGNAPAS